MRQGSVCGMLRGASSKGTMQREGEGAVVRQGRCIAMACIFLIGCAFLLLLVVGCSGTSSEAPHEGQGHNEATQKEQGHSDGAASEEAARCEGTRTYRKERALRRLIFTTNDLPDCPKGGLLSGTDKPDKLDGLDGDDEMRGLGAKDDLIGGKGDDVFYGGAGDDRLFAGKGEDVMYGGDGNDLLADKLGHAAHGQRDKLYCGEGKDHYIADKIDHVDSSC